MLSDVKNEKNLTKSEKQLKHKKHFYERESKEKCSLVIVLKVTNIFASCSLASKAIDVINILNF